MPRQHENCLLFSEPNMVLSINTETKRNSFFTARSHNETGNDDPVMVQDG